MPKFTCKNTYPNGESKKWTGTWESIAAGTDATEICIKGQGSSFHVIFGSTPITGNYLCIPSIDVGCALACWTDVFWNTERLSQILNETDAVTIATALNHYARLYNPVYDEFSGHQIQSAVNDCKLG